MTDGMAGLAIGSDRATLGVVGMGANQGVEVIAGTATYYHPSLAGGIMRDGATRYDPTASGIVAATSWPLGTVLEVRGPSRRSLTVVVSDTGMLGANRLDLSESDFRVLSGVGLDPGVIRVEIRSAE